MKEKQTIIHIFMINRISTKVGLKIGGKIARQEWARLWYFCRAVDAEGTGKVYILVPEILTLLNISRATFYRWLKKGKEAGAFREYKRIDKHTERIVLGSKTAVCQKLKITNWESVTEIPLWKILGDANIPLWQNRKKPSKVKLAKWVTIFQAHWMQLRSIEAAKQDERNRIRNKRKRRKPFVPKFSGGNGKLTSQLRAARNVRFSRKHLPTGASQKGIGESLDISECTARRHLRGVERVQVMYKVNAYEGQAELFYAKETGEPSPVFKRKGEYYRYGTNLYNLKFTHKSEFTQRLKYKFSLLLKNSVSRNSSDKLSLCLIIEEEILENLREFELDSLDYICLDVFMKLKSRSFKEFLRAIKAELKRLSRENSQRKRPR